MGELVVSLNHYLAVRDAEKLSAYLAAIEAQEAAQKASESVSRPPVTAPQATSTGPHSDAWWHGVSICEQGGRNDPYYGFFSIMDGSVGGQPWDVQVARANGIVASYGDSAWAASCVAAGYAASPDG
jgi:hypothetical protein